MKIYYFLLDKSVQMMYITVSKNHKESQNESTNILPVTFSFGLDRLNDLFQRLLVSDICRGWWGIYLVGD